MSLDKQRAQEARELVEQYAENLEEIIEDLEMSDQELQSDIQEVRERIMPEESDIDSKQKDESAKLSEIRSDLESIQNDIEGLKNSLEHNEMDSVKAILEDIKENVGEIETDTGQIEEEEKDEVSEEKDEVREIEEVLNDLINAYKALSELTGSDKWERLKRTEAGMRQLAERENRPEIAEPLQNINEKSAEEWIKKIESDKEELNGLLQKVASKLGEQTEREEQQKEGMDEELRIEQEVLGEIDNLRQGIKTNFGSEKAQELIDVLIEIEQHINSSIDEMKRAESIKSEEVQRDIEVSQDIQDKLNSVN